MNALKAQYNKMEKLRPRHHDIIRLFFGGMKQCDIAETIGISQAALSCLLNSPLARVALSQLQKEADNRVLGAVDRQDVINTLNQGAAEAASMNRRVMNDPNVDMKIRVGIGKHFLDRVIFDKQEDEGASAHSYREILRGIRAVQTQLSTTTIIAEGEEVVEENTSSV